MKCARSAILVCILLSLALPALSQEIVLRSGRVAGPSDAAPERSEGAQLVRLERALDAAMRARLESEGVRIAAMLDPGALVAWVPEGKSISLAGLPGVAWSAPYAPELRVDPTLAALSRSEGDAAATTQPVTLHLFRHADVDEIAARAASLGLPVAGRGEGRLVMLPTREQLVALRDVIASWPETFWLGRRPYYALVNDQSVWVGQAGLERPGETPVHDRGLMGEGQIVAVLDTGLDADMCYFAEDDGSLPPTTTDFATGAPDYSREKVVVVNFMWDQDNPADAGDWDTQDHGTHVAGSIAGDNLANRDVRDPGDGMAPSAQLVIQDGGYGVDDCADMPAIGCPASSLYPFFQQAYDQGARIHSNSYGDRENFTPYNIYSDGSADADRFMHDNKDFLLVFAAGNNGPGSATVASPATAKNVLSVGATSSGAGAGSLASFSSQGPTHDGRIKPDVTIPGSGIISADNDGNVESDNCSTRSMSGTSMACPTAAGLATLVREYFDKGFYPTGEADATNAFEPSAALVKAAVIASAAPMENLGAPVPSDEQGWGRILLDDVLFFPGDPKRLFAVDERAGFAGAGDDPASFQLEVIDPAEPLRAVLNWTDPASTPAASINLINDLDLEAESPSGVVYRGNVFSGGASITGGSADRVNTTEVLRIESPEVGMWTLRVRPFALPQPTQDFALVATGGIPAPGVLLERRALDLDDSVGGDADGVLEPGEWVDLPLELTNSGDTLATDVRARLVAVSPGVEIAQSVTSLPDLGTGELAASSAPHLRVRLGLDVPCTSEITLRLAYEAEGYSREEEIVLPTGTESVFLVDDLEGATGWAHVAAESTASTGDWILGDPDGTEFQPEDDTTPDPGVRALFTATNGGGLGSNDIDDGVVVARSGFYDLSGHPEARVKVSRWFANRDLGEDAGDFYALEIRESGSSPDVELERMDSTESAARWTEVSFRVADFVTPGPTIQLRVSAADGPATGNLVEAAIDDIVFWEPACDVYDPAPAAMDTLLVERSGADVVLSWAAPAATPSSGEASAYDVYRSESVQGGFGLQASVSVQSWNDAGAAGASPALYAYSVIARNDAGTGEPTP